MALSDERIRGQMFKQVIQKAIVGLLVGRCPLVDSLAYRIKTVLLELAIDRVLDVGAHEGEYAGFLRDLGYTGTCTRAGRTSRRVPRRASWRCYPARVFEIVRDGRGKLVGRRSITVDARETADPGTRQSA